MKNLIVMKRNHFATDIGMRYGLAIFVTVLFAPFWAWGQVLWTKIQKYHRESLYLLGKFA